jgi:hypothetical protein
MNTYRFEVLHPYTIIHRWGELLPHIERIVKLNNDEFTTESIKGRAVSGNGLMIAVVNAENEIIAVNTVEVVVYDSGLRALLIPVLVGSAVIEWGEALLGLCTDIAKQFNCTELRAMAIRNGWIKLLKDYGWQEKHAVIVMQIEGEG